MREKLSVVEASLGSFDEGRKMGLKLKMSAEQPHALTNRGRGLTRIGETKNSRNHG